jgi:hypothetical protein
MEEEMMRMEAMQFGAGTDPNTAVVGGSVPPRVVFLPLLLQTRVKEMLGASLELYETALHNAGRLPTVVALQSWGHDAKLDPYAQKIVVKVNTFNHTHHHARTHTHTHPHIHTHT